MAKPGTNRDKIQMKSVMLMIDMDGRRWVSFTKYFGDDGVEFPKCRRHNRLFGAYPAERGLTAHQCTRLARAATHFDTQHCTDTTTSKYLHDNGWALDWFKPQTR